MDVDLPVGAPVIVRLEGRAHAVGVGTVSMSRDEIVGTNKGIAVEMHHYLADGLWGQGDFK